MLLSGLNLASAVNVLSLLIYRDSSRESVLLGVRRPSATSARHPDVLSTPTMRIPAELMAALLAAEPGDDFVAEPPHFARLSAAPRWSIGVPYSLASPHGFAAEALICRKLGLTAALVAGELRGSLEQSALAYDLIHDDYDGYEQTLMLTMSAVLEGPPPELPGETPAYSKLGWAGTEHIDRAVRTKDTTLLFPDVSPVEVCIHGLCVRSAAYVTTAGA